MADGVVASALGQHEVNHREAEVAAVFAEDGHEALLLVRDRESVAEEHGRAVSELELDALIELEIACTEALIVDLLRAAPQALCQERCERLADRQHVLLRELASGGWGHDAQPIRYTCLAGRTCSWLVHRKSARFEAVGTADDVDLCKRELFEQVVLGRERVGERVECRFPARTARGQMPLTIAIEHDARFDLGQHDAIRDGQ